MIAAHHSMLAGGNARLEDCRYLIFAFGPPAGTVSPKYGPGIIWPYSENYPCWQLSRLELTKNGSTVALPSRKYMVADVGKGASYYKSGGNNEKPAKAFDGSLYTKYCWSDRGLYHAVSGFATFLALDFGSYAFHLADADGWRWYTANDATPGRNPLWGKVFASNSLLATDAECYGAFDIPFASQVSSTLSLGYSGLFAPTQTTSTDWPTSWIDYN